MGIVEAIADTQRPTTGAVQDQSERAGQGPAINDAYLTALEAMYHPPIGSVILWAANVLPVNPQTGFGDSHLWCTGGLYLVEDYPELYAVLGTWWNTGLELATQFRVPDLRGRVPIGAGTGAGLTNRALAALYGTETVVLTEGQMPSHDHGGTTSTNSHSHTGDTSHNFTASSIDAVGGGTSFLRSASNVSGTTDLSSHSHNLNIDNAGSNQAHANVQPSVGMNFIIRARR